MGEVPVAASAVLGGSEGPGAAGAAACGRGGPVVASAGVGASEGAVKLGDTVHLGGQVV